MDDEESSVTEYTPVWDRYDVNYQTDLNNGSILEAGPYSLLETDNEWGSTHHFVEYELPLEEGGAAPNGLISLAVLAT